METDSSFHSVTDEGLLSPSNFYRCLSLALWEQFLLSISFLPSFLSLSLFSLSFLLFSLRITKVPCLADLDAESPLLKPAGGGEDPSLPFVASASDPGLWTYPSSLASLPAVLAVRQLFWQLWLWSYYHVLSIFSSVSGSHFASLFMFDTSCAPQPSFL